MATAAAMLAPWCSDANTIALPVLAFLLPADSIFFILLVALVVTTPCMATAKADAETLHWQCCCHQPDACFLVPLLLTNAISDVLLGIIVGVALIVSITLVTTIIAISTPPVDFSLLSSLSKPVAIAIVTAWQHNSSDCHCRCFTTG